MLAVLDWDVLAQTHGYASRVQFRLACSKIPKDVLLLEIGPHALMRSPLRQNRSDLQYVATMKKGESAVETLSAAVADLWRKGAIFNWPVSAAPSAGAHPERESEDAPFTPGPLHSSTFGMRPSIGRIRLCGVQSWRGVC